MIIGLGIDLVNIDRMGLLIEKWQDKIINRLFTDRERLYCSRRKNSHQHYASTFAVKEAIIKAYGSGDVKFKEIEVIRHDSGKPSVSLYRSTKDKITSIGTELIHVSISHDRGYSIAVAILENNNRE